MSLFTGPIKTFAEKLIVRMETQAKKYAEDSNAITPDKPELAYEKLRRAMLAETLVEVSKHLREVSGL